MKSKGKLAVAASIPVLLVAGGLALSMESITGLHLGDGAWLVNSGGGADAASRLPQNPVYTCGYIPPAHSQALGRDFAASFEVCPSCDVILINEPPDYMTRDPGD